jgi:hypothetical protein
VLASSRWLAACTHQRHNSWLESRCAHCVTNRSRRPALCGAASSTSIERAPNRSLRPPRRPRRWARARTWWSGRHDGADGVDDARGEVGGEGGTSGPRRVARLAGASAVRGRGSLREAPSQLRPALARRAVQRARRRQATPGHGVSLRRYAGGDSPNADGLAAWTSGDAALALTRRGDGWVIRLRGGGGASLGMISERPSSAPSWPTPGARGRPWTGSDRSD